MKRGSLFLNILNTLILIWFAASNAFAQTPDCTSKTDDINGYQVTFLNNVDGNAKLRTEDKFLKNMNELNFSMRLLSSEAVSKEAYLDFVTNQTLCWSEGEIQEITQNIKIVFSKLEKKGLKGLIKGGLSFIKTTGLDEARAHYVRGNSIIVPFGEIVMHALVHEIFHVFTNERDDLVEELFSLVGFNRRSLDLTIPYDIQGRVLVNPDAPNYDYSILLTNNETGATFEALPIITSFVALDKISKDVDSFFRYINFHYYDVSNFSTVDLDRTNFDELTGGNTAYSVHPEEILAENFSFMVQDDTSVKSLWPLEAVRAFIAANM